MNHLGSRSPALDGTAATAPGRGFTPWALFAASQQWDIRGLCGLGTIGLLLIGLAARSRMPAVYPFRYFATVGGLLSYGSDATDLWRRSAAYVDRILRGAKPGDLPVQAPTKFELAINLKTAKALGLQVPPSLLARADEVIE